MKKYGEISNWDTSSVTDMKEMFYYPFGTSFTTSRSRSNVTHMSFMFLNATSFNRPLNNWNVSKVEDMSGMFKDAESFNEPLNNWNVSNDGI